MAESAAPKSGDIPADFQKMKAEMLTEFKDMATAFFSSLEEARKETPVHQVKIINKRNRYRERYIALSDDTSYRDNDDSDDSDSSTNSDGQERLHFSMPKDLIETLEKIEVLSDDEIRREHEEWTQQRWSGTNFEATQSPRVSLGVKYWWDNLKYYRPKEGSEQQTPFWTPEILEQYYGDLFPALFPLENENVGTGSHYYRRETVYEYEFSRSPRLLLIMWRLSCWYQHQKTKLPFGTLLAMLIEIAKWRQKLGKRGFVKGKLPKLMESMVEEKILQPPSSTLDPQISTNALKSEQRRFWNAAMASTKFLTSNCLSLDATDFRGRVMSRPGSMVTVGGMGLLEVGRARRENANEASILPVDLLNVRSLCDPRLGGLTIEWVAEMSRHLTISNGHLQVYWYASTLSKASSKSRREEIMELERTYALLFRPISRRSRKHHDRILPNEKSVDNNNQDQFFFDDISVYGGDKPSQGKMKIDLKLTEDPCRSILESYLKQDLPEEVQVVTGVKIIGDMIRKGPPYLQDVVIHVRAILRNRLKQNEPLEDYPQFGSELRFLKMYALEYKPSGFKQLWFNRRDTLGWYTIWAALILGTTSVLIAFGSLLTSVIQTWWALRG